MTREEAIQVLKKTIAYESDFAEAKRMATEALSERNIAREIATILENEQDMRVMLQMADRPQGKWIHQTRFGRIECDQCGKVYRNTFAPKNFCPNCGARMKGGDSE